MRERPDHASPRRRTSILRHLGLVDARLADADAPTRAALAETEIPRLVAAWRTVLATHRPDSTGRCPHCRGWRRQRRFPCSVWLTAHACLIVADARSIPPATSPHSPPGNS